MRVAPARRGVGGRRQGVGLPLPSPGLLEIQGPDGSRSVMPIEVRGRAEPRETPAIVDRARRYRSRPLILVAPYLGPRTRERLSLAGVSYADSTGNLRVALAQPALFIETSGAQSNPWPDDRPLRSLRGRAAGRTVRALCDFRPPYGIRELAARAGIPAPTVARVVDLLDREAIVEREPRGRVIAVDWPALIRRWARDYSFVESNRAGTFLEPRGLAALIQKLRQSPLEYSVTGHSRTELQSIDVFVVWAVLCAWARRITSLSRRTVACRRTLLRSLMMFSMSRATREKLLCRAYLSPR